MSVAHESKTTTIRHGASVVTLTALRVGVGIVMLVHGWDKLTSISDWQQSVAQLQLPLPEVLAYLAVAGEVLGGIGLIAGVLTPLAAFGVLCTMLVAVFAVHLPNGLLARDNGFEYPMTLALVAAYFMTFGAGPISVDALVNRLRSEGEATPVPEPRVAASKEQRIGTALAWSRDGHKA